MGEWRNSEDARLREVFRVLTISVGDRIAGDRMRQKVEWAVSLLGLDQDEPPEFKSSSLHTFLKLDRDTVKRRAERAAVVLGTASSFSLELDYPNLLCSLENDQACLAVLAKRLKSRRVLLHPDKLPSEFRDLGEEATKAVASAHTVLTEELSEYCRKHERSIRASWDRWHAVAGAVARGHYRPSSSTRPTYSAVY